MQRNADPLQVVNGLTSLLGTGNNTGNSSSLSSLESYNTALSFVQAFGRTQDSHGNTTAVSPVFSAQLPDVALTLLQVEKAQAVLRTLDHAAILLHSCLHHQSFLPRGIQDIFLLRCCM